MYGSSNPARTAIVTCMDPRLRLPRALGYSAGEPFMLRNGGGRVTDDVLRGLVLCTRLMQVTEVGVIHHTDCRLQDTNERLVRRTGIDRDYLAFPDPVKSVLQDIDELRSSGIFGPLVRVWGGLYDTADHTVCVVADTHDHAGLATCAARPRGRRRPPGPATPKHG